MHGGNTYKIYIITPNDLKQTHKRLIKSQRLSVNHFPFLMGNKKQKEFDKRVWFEWNVLINNPEIKI